MNLIKCDITEVHSEKKMGLYVIADVTVNWFGHKNRIKYEQNKKQWEIYKQKGFLLI